MWRSPLLEARHPRGRYGTFRKYSLEYVHAENDAREARRGIWRGEFEMPWEWRAARRKP
jgi:endonuclease YncB( thermonuclease family)